jgi:signal transduction histidine kinase
MELTPVFAQVAAGWPLAASLAAVAVRGVYSGRRRSALNECLHELRRPLQALALAAPAGRAEAAESSLQLAAQALERLDREINGGGRPPVRSAAVCADSLVGAAAARWRPWAERQGGALEVRREAGGALVAADPAALGQALDNLVVNAIEHGGPRLRLEARREAGELVLAVVDSGRRRGPAPSQRASRAVDRLRGRHRHGHGLRVVRRVAAEHGGCFVLRRSRQGGEARLRLPLAEPES